MEIKKGWFNLPSTTTENMSESPMQKQSSLILLIPYPTPLRTEQVATLVIDQMMIS